MSKGQTVPISAVIAAPKLIIPLALAGALAGCACLDPGGVALETLYPGGQTEAAPPETSTTPGAGLGNPGNAKGVGRAGEDPPGAGDMNAPDQGGPGTRGASDGGAGKGGEGRGGGKG